jgi:transcriptional regulator with XRE-family HTH domain
MTKKVPTIPLKTQATAQSPATQQTPTITLGSHLAELRTSRGLSLREVEEATEKAVSNAYLSQVERGKILQPSPNILYSLSEIYGVPYESLMEMAGYIMPLSQRDDNKKHGKVITSAFGYLTKDEEKELIEYLKFVRFRNRE